MTNIYGLFQRAEEQILLVQNFKNQQKTKRREKKTCYDYALCILREANTQ